MTVASGALPDLIVTAVTWTPAAPTRGKRLRSAPRLRIKEPPRRQPSYTWRALYGGWNFRQFFRTRHGVAGGWGQYYLDRERRAGGSTWTATAGTHTIVANVDDVNRIAESNEGNNTLSASMTVAASGGPPDLIVTAVTWTPATPTAGQAVTFSATIKNQGTGPTAAGVIHGVLFTVDGTSVNWSDTSTASLAAGASRTVTRTTDPAAHRLGRPRWNAHHCRECG